MRPRALDLFCGGGGVTEGLRRAGFEVVGVDADPKCERSFVGHSRLGKAGEPPVLRHGGPGRTCPGCAMHPPADIVNPAVFVQADALEFLDRVIAGQHGHFDFIWASPPCQAHSVLRKINPGREYPDLIPATRELLQRWGGLWVIENVPGAPLGGGASYLTMLCGTMFGLGIDTPEGGAEIQRHRLFETSFCTGLRPACQHGHIGIESLTVTGTGMGPGNRGKDAHMAAKRAVVTVVGKKGLPGTSHSRRALSVTGHATEVSAANWGRRREVITVSGDRCNSANTPRVICVAGGKAMAGGMMTPQGELKRRVLTVAGDHPASGGRHPGRQTFSTDDARAAMGIDWMPMAYLSQAIPPEYARWIGLQALAFLSDRRRA
jgi:DNA (cytosine-5)-methyltransferase 1